MVHGFWDELPRPFFVLAPMADVTDAPFRAIVTRCGRPDVFYTEFVSAHGLASVGRARLLQDLTLTASDHPIVAQFFGTEPEYMHAAAVTARDLGFDGVDINMGCPDRAVVKQGAGIALAKDPGRARELIAALRDGAGDLPVVVKTRLGLYATDEMDTWIPAVLAAKPDVLVVHGRTMKEMSAVPAHWDLIGRAAAMAHDVGVLCVGNGDIMSRLQGQSLAREHGVDGLMVGRGIFHDPWMFSPDVREHTPEERIALLREHIDLWLAQWDGIKSFALMKKFFKMYISGWPGAAELRAQLMEKKSADEIRALMAVHA
ncbi:MAG TPA: tRNA-dihydrouridine synthase [Candidatus Paceibacterota bacterium]|nr:tRNA-dihydrouridine synthase [Candidatus Paceibacterota bacterium]